jgi:hypothetical protein
MSRITKKQATLAALGIVSVVLTLGEAKAHGQDICYDPQNPSAPPMACAPGTSVVPLPPTSEIIVAPPYTGPQLATTTTIVVQLAPPLSVVSTAVKVDPSRNVSEDDPCGDYGDKDPCAALIATKFGPAKTTQRPTHYSKPYAKGCRDEHYFDGTHEVICNTNGRLPVHIPSVTVGMTPEEYRAFVEAFVAPLFVSFVP